MISGLKHYEKHQEDFGIAMTEEFESEVQDMCNLGKALVEQGIEQGIEQVQALQQAVKSAEQAVIGEKKGVQAGTRTFVDALDAERRLYEAIRDHALAAYTLANNRIKFLAQAGVVDIEAIEKVSVWLASAKL